MVANIVWILITLLAIVYYVIQFTLFSDIQDYIGIIINSEKRVNDLMNMNLRLNEILLINENISTEFNHISSNKTIVLYTYLQEFLLSTTNLKDSQTQLSLKTSNMNEDARKRINPENVVLELESIPELPNMISYNIWEAIM